MYNAVKNFSTTNIKKINFQEIDSFSLILQEIKNFRLSHSDPLLKFLAQLS